jgi:leucyl-tRNA synthetase
VDIADIATRTAIEVGGRTHSTKKWKFLDRRKTEILNALGWSVLRFWNKEVMEDLNGVLERVRQFTTSRSQTITTILPTEL